MALFSSAALNNLGTGGKINTGILGNASNTLASFGQNAQSSAHSALSSIVNSGKGMTSTFSGIMGDLGREMKAFDFGKVAQSGIEPFKQAGSNIINDSIKAIGGLKDNLSKFAGQFSPSKWSSDPIGTFKNLANVLMCPEEMLLPMFTNAFSAIVGSLKKNLQPKELLQRALSNMVGSIIQQLPSLNTLVSFVKDIVSYLGTLGFGKSDVLEEIEKVLIKFELLPNYLTGIKTIDNLLDSLRSHNKNNQSGYLSSYVPPLLPKLDEDSVVARCSVIAKIISQLLASYRANNRFDDLEFRKAVLASIDDPALKERLSNYMGAEDLAKEEFEAKMVAARNGFFGDSALNNVLSVAVENAQTLDEMEAMLKDLRDGKLPPTPQNKIKLLKKMAYLDNLNKVAYDKLCAFEEEMKNISEEAANHYLKEVFDEMAKGESGQGFPLNKYSEYVLHNKERYAENMSKDSTHELLSQSNKYAELRKTILGICDKIIKSPTPITTLEMKMELLILVSSLSAINSKVTTYLGSEGAKILKDYRTRGDNDLYHPLSTEFFARILVILLANTCKEGEEARFYNTWNDDVLGKVLFVFGLEYEESTSDANVETSGYPYNISRLKLRESGDWASNITSYIQAYGSRSDDLSIMECASLFIRMDNSHPVMNHLYRFIQTGADNELARKFIKVEYSTRLLKQVLESYYFDKKYYALQTRIPTKYSSWASRMDGITKFNPMAMINLDIGRTPSKFVEAFARFNNRYSSYMDFQNNITQNGAF